MDTGHIKPLALPTLRLSQPGFEFRTTSATTMAVLARLIASGEASNKAELAAVTGLSRTTVTAAVERLLRAGILRREGAVARAGRGRPADCLGIAPGAGTVLIFDCGAQSSRLAIANLGQQILAERTVDLAVAIGPGASLDALRTHMEELIAESGVEITRACTVIGLPARLDYVNGTPVRPAIMPGWDGFRVIEPLQAAFGFPVIVENDVNLRALGESRALAPDQSPLVAVKVGTGIGAGLVTGDGAIHRGSGGASGEMGHITLRSAPDTHCVCGSVGCLEAVASVPALLRLYAGASEEGVEPPHTADEFAQLVRDADPLAAALVRDSAVYLGEAIADIVHVFNPARVVISGPTTSASDDLLARVRSIIYEHARPLATRNLQVAFSTLGERAGIAGALVLGIEHLLSPDALADAFYYRDQARRT